MMGAVFTLRTENTLLCVLLVTLLKGGDRTKSHSGPLVLIFGGEVVIGSFKILEKEMDPQLPFTLHSPHQCTIRCLEWVNEVGGDRGPHKTGEEGQRGGDMPEGE